MAITLNYNVVCDTESEYTNVKNDLAGNQDIIDYTENDITKTVTFKVIKND